MKPINLLNVNEELHKILYTNRKGEELMKIDNETDELLPELLDEIRDKIVEKTGQQIDWRYHGDTNLEKIVIVWYVGEEE